MFRAITKGLNEFFKRRGSVEMSEISEASTALKAALGRGQPQPIQQPNSQPNVTTATSSTGTAQPVFQRTSTASSMSRLSFSGGNSSPQVTEVKSSKLLSPDNPVTVRIWTSKTADGRDTYGINAIMGKGNVGHATLETNKIYASIWPEDPVSLFRLKQPVTSAYQDSVVDDIRLENQRKPDHVFVFYSLDVKAIEKIFEAIKISKEPWTLFGNLIADKAHSCSSLTLLLLEHGGLDKIVNSKIRGVVSPTSNFVVSPNNLVNQLSLAQRLEGSKFPEILDFDRVGSKARLPGKESLILTVIAEKITIMDAQEKLQTETDKKDESTQLRGS